MRSVGDLGCLHQPNLLTFGTSHKKKTSSLNFNLLSSLAKSGLPDLLYIGCSDKGQTRWLQNERKGPHSGSRSHMGGKGPLWTQQNRVCVPKEALLFSWRVDRLLLPVMVYVNVVLTARFSLPAGNVKYSSSQQTFPDLQYCTFQQMPLPSPI